MKIVHVLYGGLGGHASLFFSLVKQTFEKEVNTEIACVFYGIEDVPAFYIDFCKKNNIAFYFVKKEKGIDLKYFSSIFNEFKKTDPDVIFLHGSYNILPAKFYSFFNKKTKIIVRETQNNKLKTKLEWVNLALCLLLSNYVVFLSDIHNYEVKKRLGLFYKKSKISIIPNGLDINALSNSKRFFEIDFSISNDFILIGMASRLVNIKDHTSLIEAIYLLKDKTYFNKIRLLIAGEGDSMDTLVKITEKFNLEYKITFLGLLNNEQIIEFMHSLSIYVHATWGEAMSNSIMQAQASGLPIIASNVEGVNNVIDDGNNGLLVKPGAANDYAVAIDKLITNNELRNVIAKKSLNYALQNLSSEKMYFSYSKLFNAL